MFVMARVPVRQGLPCADRKVFTRLLYIPCGFFLEIRNGATTNHRIDTELYLKDSFDLYYYSK